MCLYIKPGPIRLADYTQPVHVYHSMDWIMYSSITWITNQTRGLWLMSITFDHRVRTSCSKLLQVKGAMKLHRPRYDLLVMDVVKWSIVNTWSVKSSHRWSIWPCQSSLILTELVNGPNQLNVYPSSMAYAYIHHCSCVIPTQYTIYKCYHTWFRGIKWADITGIWNTVLNWFTFYRLTTIYYHKFEPKQSH